MADLTEHTDVDLPARQVWDVIGDFAAISKWAPRIQGQTTEDTADGRVRSLPMGPDRVVREIEVVSSEFSYTYGMLDRPPAYEYRSTIAVIPLGQNRSRILLVHHVVDPDADDSALAERYTKFLRGNLKAMRIALGA
ncbi:MAG TPA: SRPBCC family protein [Streptosporangiaceae bacterium]|jgi:uncharacterized protein YndB with AHSA1/START domain|nr:SRPBCC family protein [Streptosporangiaceae bacterium]